MTYYGKVFLTSSMTRSETPLWRGIIFESEPPRSEVWRGQPQTSRSAAFTEMSEKAESLGDVKLHEPRADSVPV